MEADVRVPLASWVHTPHGLLGPGSGGSQSPENAPRSSTGPAVSVISGTPATLEATLGQPDSGPHCGSRLKRLEEARGQGWDAPDAATHSCGGAEGTPRAPEDPPPPPAGVGTSPPLKWLHLFPFPAPPLPCRRYSPTPPAPCVLSSSPCPHPSPLPALSLGPPLAPGPTSTPRSDPLRGFRGESASVPRGHEVSRMPVGW